MSRITEMPPLGELNGSEYIELVQQTGEGGQTTYRNFRYPVTSLMVSGPAGKSAYETAVEFGFEGSEIDWYESLKGKSAYQVAVAHGYTGTEEHWLASLVGQSAYQIAVEQGFEGNKADWLATLAGKDGEDGNTGLSAYELAQTQGFEGTLGEWVESLAGADGLSAYDVAVAEGYSGTVVQWLATLRGETGERGPRGLSAYEVAASNGYVGSPEEWLASLRGNSGEDGETGPTGASAYQVALNEGFVGSVEEWLESLKGRDGDDAGGLSHVHNYHEPILKLVPEDNGKYFCMTAPHRDQVVIIGEGEWVRDSEIHVEFTLDTQDHDLPTNLVVIDQRVIDTANSAVESDMRVIRGYRNVVERQYGVITIKCVVGSDSGIRPVFSVFGGIEPGDKEFNFLVEFDNETDDIKFLVDHTGSLLTYGDTPELAIEDVTVA